MDERASHVGIGIDVGGTFTDVVVHDPATGALEAFKVPSTPSDPTRAVVAAIDRLRAGGRRIGAVMHGTTVATNAMLEGTTARTALVTTRGFRDVLEIARSSRENLYHLHDNGRPVPLVPRHLRFEVTERLGARRRALVPLPMAGVERVRAALAAHRAEAVAVCLLRGDVAPQRGALPPRLPSRGAGPRGSGPPLHPCRKRSERISEEDLPWHTLCLRGTSCSPSGAKDLTHFP